MISICSLATKVQVLKQAEAPMGGHTTFCDDRYECIEYTDTTRYLFSPFSGTHKCIIPKEISGLNIIFSLENFVCAVRVQLSNN